MTDAMAVALVGVAGAVLGSLLTGTVALVATHLANVHARKQQAAAQAHENTTRFHAVRLEVYSEFLGHTTRVLVDLKSGRRMDVEKEREFINYANRLDLLGTDGVRGAAKDLLGVIWSEGADSRTAPPQTADVGRELSVALVREMRKELGTDAVVIPTQGVAP